METKNRLFKLYINLIVAFIKNNSGSIVIAFAIMFPTILLCFGASLNHAHTLKTRAKISEATNEASLAIIAINNKNEGQDAINSNKKLALSYINYYMTGKTQDFNDNYKIDISYNKNNNSYHVYYQNDYKNLLSNLGKGMSSDTAIGSHNESYGNTRKDDVVSSIDIGFVADFSGSNTCNYNDISCNDYTAVSSDSNRLTYMRKAISNIIDQFKDYQTIKFAFIPYDIGVPTQNKKQNPAGGSSYSCSLLYKLKAPYSSIDYDFWASQNILYTKWSAMKEQGVIQDYAKYPYFDDYNNTIFYYLDYYRYYYYANIIGPALGYKNDYSLSKSNLCSKVEYVDSVILGRYKYSCGQDKSDYPLSVENQERIKKDYGPMVQLYDYMYSGDYDTHFSLANTQTVDIPGTLETLFSSMKENTITFTRPIAPSMSEFTPFMGMCSSPIYSNKMMIGGDDKLTRIEVLDNASKTVKNFKDAPHLVEFDTENNNSVELASYLNNNQWQPGGGTDTITALLRSVPVFAKGDGNHKLIIIVSDGKDDSGADTLRDNFLAQGACQTITRGLTSASNEKQGFIARAANSATIHYIKLSPTLPQLDTDTDYKNEFGAWFTECMNGNKNLLHVATDYKSLLDVSQYIIKTETGSFIKK